MRQSATFLLVLLLSCTGNGQAKLIDFDGFCHKFFSDRAFQTAHISFPLLRLQPDEELGDLDTVMVQRHQWEFSDFGYGKQHTGSVDAYEVRTYDNWKLKKTKKLRSTQERVIGFEGIDNGIKLRLYFSLASGEWILVRIEDWSD